MDLPIELAYQGFWGLLHADDCDPNERKDAFRTLALLCSNAATSMENSALPAYRLKLQLALDNASKLASTN